MTVPPASFSALDGTNGFTIDGIDNGDRAGFSVASAGDVNGDGFADVIVGAAYASDDLNYVGEAYVVFGSADWTGVANFDPATLDGTNGFRLEGAGVDERAGFDVSSAGDVNGDGFDDVFVGTPGLYDGSFYGDGGGYVIFGRADWSGTAVVDMQTVDGTDGFALRTNGDGFPGYDVSSAGDVNGDGFGDLIIGTRYGSVSPGNDEGFSYVVFGKADWSATAELDLAALDGTDGFRIDGTDPQGNAGWAVSGAGDVNGDGFADVIVGAPYAEPGTYGDEGISYVVFGKADWSGDATFDLSTINGTNGFSIDGSVTYGYSGISVGAAGDVNGDGFGDVVVTARYDDDGYSYGGAAYVVFGKPDWSTTASVGLAGLDGTGGFRVQGDYDAAYQIASAQGAGDVNGDGFDDLVIGSPIDSGYGGYGTGAAYVVFGKADWSATPILGLLGLASSDGFRVQGAASYDGAGASVNGAGDVDGDGFDDIIVGAPGSSLVAPTGGPGPADYGSTAGQAHVVFGGDFSSIVTLEGDDSGNSLDGTAGDDVIFAGAGEDTVFGLGGHDFLNGGAGADTLIAGDGDDTVDGAAGDDLIIGGSGAGNDTYTGGLGIDEVSYASTTAGVTVDLGAGTATGPEIGTDTLISIEAVVGGGGQDTLTGDGGANTLDGGAASDSLLGGAGDDVYVFDAAYGSDTITDSGGTDTVRTALDEPPSDLTRDGDDFLLTLNDGSSLRIVDHFAGTGHSVESVEVLGDFTFTLNLLTGLVGTPDSDIIVGTGGGETLVGNGDSDLLYAGGGNDSLDGGSGEDDLRGGAGNDHVFGGDDDDELVGNAGDDSFDGGDGWDEVAYDQDGGAGAVIVDLSAGTATDTHGDTDTLTNIEAVIGTALGDHMIGDAGRINFRGRAGNDLLEGADGDDVLDGGAGTDVLDGGAGWDGVWYSDDEEDGGAAGVVVNLGLGTATDGFGDTDTLIGIEWVSGTAQADTLTGADSTTDEVEWFAALGGNDTIDGGTGGFDIVSYTDDDNRGGSAAVVVNLSTGTATDGFGSTDTLIDIEAVDGTRFGDHLIGDGLWNQLQGLDGDDTIDGNGSDIVGQGGFVDNLIGGAGNDTYVIDIGDKFAWINNVSDASLGEINTFAFGAGIDASHLSLFEIGGDLEITYAPGDVVRLVGWSGPDAALARQVDFSFGGGGSMVVVVSGPGTAGDDLIFGTTAVDTLYAGAGDDTYDGGGDIDILIYESTTAGVTVDLGAGTAFGSEIGTDDLTSIENVAGGSGNDTLTGDSVANTLLGLGGGDTLEGGGGSDVLFGDTDPPAVPLTFTDIGLFPDVTEFVDIGDLPAPGDGALGIVGDDLSVGDHAVATLTLAGGTAGYANSVGLYSVAADGTITDGSLAFEDVQALDPGDAATVTLPGGPGNGFGLFLIVHGARLKGGYQSFDLEAGTLAFIHDFGGAGERAAKITDSGAEISLVFDDGETKTVLQGPVVHSTERGCSALLNADGTMHVAAGQLTAGNDTTLRVGFEDTPGGGDSDFNDVIVDVGFALGEPGGADTLVGGSGDDTLTGGFGDDVFVFGAGGGTDRITDFEVGKDLFDLKDGVTISTITTVDADGDSFMDDTLVTLSDGAVELIGVTGVTGTDLLP